MPCHRVVVECRVGRFLCAIIEVGDEDEREISESGAFDVKRKEIMEILEGNGPGECDSIVAAEWWQT